MERHDSGPRGWISYSGGPGGKAHLPPAVRAWADRREAELASRRGGLLCEVTVRVYERDTEESAMQVSFPPGSLLGPDSDSAQIAAAVARARDQLARWR